MGKLGIKILKMSLLVGSIAAIILLSTNYFVFNKEEKELRAHVKANANEIVSSIDAVKLQRIIDARSSDIAEYNDVLTSMLLHKGRTDIKNIYVFIKMDDKTAEFLLDASPDPAGFLEKYDMDEAILNTFRTGTLTADNEITRDKWGSTVSAYAPIKDASGKVIAIVGIDDDVSVFQDIKHFLFVMNLFAFGMFAVLCIVISYFFSKGLQKNIKQIQGNLNEIEQGDLSRDIIIKSKDEIEIIGKSINGFKGQVSGIFSHIKNNTENIAQKSNKLSEVAVIVTELVNDVSVAIENVTKGNGTQANDLFEITNIMNKFSFDLDQIVKSIGDIGSHSIEISKMANESDSNMKSLMESVNKIEIGFKDFINKIDRVEADISRIDEMANIINGISEQTNLLALNASIEAARAGEQGRGFAVVAEEIRKLAEQSKSSSGNINLRIKEISSSTKNMVETADLMNNELNEEATKIKITTNSFKRIISGLNEMIPKIETVNNSVVKVDEEKNVVLKNIENISSVSEEISASSEEVLASVEGIKGSFLNVASTSIELNDSTENMLSQIQKYKLHKS